MPVEYTEYTFLQIYLSNKKHIEYILYSETGTFDYYDENPSDPNYTRDINRYYSINMTTNYIPRVIYDNGRFQSDSFQRKYERILKNILQFELNTLDLRVVRDRHRKIKNHSIRRNVMYHID